MNDVVTTEPVNTDALLSSNLVKHMSKESDLDPNAFLATVRNTCFTDNVTREQFLAFLMVANEHKLNPITREIYGFMNKGRIQPIVSIDGWLKMINENPQLDGMEFEDHTDDDGKIVAITCKIHRKDRKFPTEVTEYLSECRRDTAMWKKWPARMLRHKATIQAARYAFSFAGIIEPDEAERIMDAQVIDAKSEVVEEPPKSEADAILAKIVPDAPVEEVVAEEEAEILEEQEGLELETEEEAAAVAEALSEDPDAEVDLDDIPGLKKGSEVEKK